MLEGVARLRSRHPRDLSILPRSTRSRLVRPKQAAVVVRFSGHSAAGAAPRRRSAVAGQPASGFGVRSSSRFVSGYHEKRGSLVSYGGRQARATLHDDQHDWPAEGLILHGGRLGLELRVLVASTSARSPGLTQERLQLFSRGPLRRKERGGYLHARRWMSGRQSTFFLYHARAGDLPALLRSWGDGRVYVPGDPAVQPYPWSRDKGGQPARPLAARYEQLHWKECAGGDARREPSR